MGAERHCTRWLTSQTEEAAFGKGSEELSRSQEPCPLLCSSEPVLSDGEEIS